jgi:hypothetical protein
MKKVVCFVNTTKKHTDRIDNVLETWAQKIDTVFYSDHEDFEKNVLKVSNRDDYASGEEKQINILNTINNLTNGEDEIILDVYEWLFFVDDDTFVNVDNLTEYIQTLDENKVYGSVFDSEKDSENPMYVNNVVPKDAKFPSGGAGFLVSSKIVRSIQNFSNYNTSCGDVSAGLNFYFNNIDQEHSTLFNSQNPDLYNHSEETQKEMISYHYIKTLEEMQNLFNA